MAIISICIPAYKRLDFLKRLLDSIVSQTFKDYEVIVTDDTPDESVEKLSNAYNQILPLSYFKNPVALGTPENWNEAIRKARGNWIKLMHDDDWFAFSDTLQKLFELTKDSEKTSFIFCGSTIIENDKVFDRENISHFREKLLRKDPQNLFFRNFIGPPSVIMHRRETEIWYDKRMKWLVDVDFYIRYLERCREFNFTREYLINVGFNEGQVTRQVLYDRNVVIPENLLLLEKLDHKILWRLWNYDFCWRLLRNYQIKSVDELCHLHPNKNNTTIPKPLVHILKAQKRIPEFMIKVGIISKMFMLLNYFTFHLTHWRK